MKSPIQSLEVSYLIHETEDHERVKRAVQAVLGSTPEPTVERLEGHHGNGILKATVHVTGDVAASAFEEVLKRMPGPVREEVVANIGSLVDQRSALFLRFDKQLLVSGTLALGSGDPVRIKVKPRGFMKGGADSFYRGLFGG